MQIPKTINKLIESFEKLPGVGPKTAQRLTFYLLHVPQGQLDIFANSLSSLKKDTVVCENCFMIDEKSPCSICSNKSRQQELVCVVEEPLDVLAFEKNGKYNGLYHVLHGKIDPLNNIGPDEIYIRQLLDRLKKSSNGSGHSSIKEVILATNPTMEGEATAMYIAKKFGELKTQNSRLKTVKITRIGRGLPQGADLEYAD